jgi:hypothetical protein
MDYFILSSITINEEDLTPHLPSSGYKYRPDKNTSDDY